MGGATGSSSLRKNSKICHSEPRSVFERGEESPFSLIFSRTADPSPANRRVRDDKSDRFRSLLVDRALSQLGAKRRVALTLPFFVPAIFAIAQTDLILTVPRRLAKITAVMAGARVSDARADWRPFTRSFFWVSWLSP